MAKNFSVTDHMLRAKQTLHASVDQFVQQYSAKTGRPFRMDTTPDSWSDFEFAIRGWSNAYDRQILPTPENMQVLYGDFVRDECAVWKATIDKIRREDEEKKRNGHGLALCGCH